MIPVDDDDVQICDVQFQKWLSVITKQTKPTTSSPGPGFMSASLIPDSWDDFFVLSHLVSVHDIERVLNPSNMIVASELMSARRTIEELYPMLHVYEVQLFDTYRNTWTRTHVFMVLLETALDETLGFGSHAACYARNIGSEFRG